MAAFPPQNYLYGSASSRMRCSQKGHNKEEVSVTRLEDGASTAVVRSEASRCVVSDQQMSPAAPD